jgi:hypothetical protein
MERGTLVQTQIFIDNGKQDVGSNATLDKYQCRGTGQYAVHDLWLVVYSPIRGVRQFAHVAGNRWPTRGSIRRFGFLRRHHPPGLSRGIIPLPEQIRRIGK